MKFSSVLEKMKKDGVRRCLKYYVCRLVSKASMYFVGAFTRRLSAREDLIVFKNREMQDFSDNARAMFEYLTENGYEEKYQIVYMASEPRRFRKLNSRSVKFVTAESPDGFTSPRAYYYGCRARYFFYTNHSADLNRFHGRGQVTVNLWHGCGYKGATRDKKDIAHSATMTAFDYAVVPGPVFVETKSRYWNCPKEKLLAVGYPRYDWMLAARQDRDRLLGKLFGPEFTGKKAVIWMPTFRQSSLKGYAEGKIRMPFALPALDGAEDLKRLDGLCGEYGLVLLIRKHPLQTGWEEKDGSFRNIRYVPQELLDAADVQLYSLVGAMDALISDYSSIAVDYLLMDRPLAFVLTDYEQYRAARGFVFENPTDYMPGEKIYDFGGLKEFLGHVGEGKDLYAGERAGLLPQMHNVSENYRAALAKAVGL